MISPDGRRLYYAADDGVRVLDTATGRETGSGPVGRGTSPSVSSDGRLLLLDDPEQAETTVVDLRTGARLGAVSAPSALLTVGEFRPGAQEMFVVPWNRRGSTMRRYRPDGTPVGPARRSPLPSITDAFYAPDGGRLVVTGGNRAQVLDADTLEPVGTAVAVPGSRIGDGTVAPDGRRIAFSADDGSVTVVSLEDGSVLASIDGPAGSLLVEWLDDDRLLLATPDVAAEYNLRRATALGSAREAGAPVSDVVTDDAARLVLAVAESGVEASSADGGPPPAFAPVLPAGWAVLGAALSPDGRLAAIHRGRFVGDTAVEAVVDLVDPGDGSVRRAVRLDGSREVDRIIPRLAFSPDGTRLAVGVLSGSLAVVDVATGRVTLPFVQVDTTPFALRAVRWSSDGRTLFTGGQDGVLRSVDPRTGRVRSQVALSPTTALTDADWVPGTSRLAVSSEAGAVYVVDSLTMRRVGPTLTAGGTQLQSVAVRPDGRVVAAVSRDGAVRLWDLGSGLSLGPPLRAHSDQTIGIAFVGSGARLVTGGFDRRVVTWSMDPGDWVRRACALAGRDLTHEEWSRYLPDLPYRRTCTGRS